MKKLGLIAILLAPLTVLLFAQRADIRRSSGVTGSDLTNSANGNQFTLDSGGKLAIKSGAIVTNLNPSGLYLTNITDGKVLLAGTNGEVYGGQVTLTTQVTGILPVANGGSSSGTVITSGASTTNTIAVYSDTTGTNVVPKTLAVGDNLTITQNATTVTVAGNGNYTTASKTAAYSVLAADSGTHFDNFGASALVVCTLPAGVVGMHYTFNCVDADKIEADCVGADKMRIYLNISSAGSDGGGIRLNAIGNSMTITFVGNNLWLVEAYTGVVGVDITLL